MSIEDEIDRGLRLARTILAHTEAAAVLAASMPRDTPDERAAYLQAMIDHTREGAAKVQAIVDEAPPQPPKGRAIRVAMTPVAPCDWLAALVDPAYQPPLRMPERPLQEIDGPTWDGDDIDEREGR